MSSLEAIEFNSRLYFCRRRCCRHPGVHTTTGVVSTFWPPTCRPTKLDVYQGTSADSTLM